MIKVRILDRCEFCDGDLYIMIIQDNMDLVPRRLFLGSLSLDVSYYFATI